MFDFSQLIPTSYMIGTGMLFMAYQLRGKIRKTVKDYRNLYKLVKPQCDNSFIKSNIMCLEILYQSLHDIIYRYNGIGIAYEVEPGVFKIPYIINSKKYYFYTKKKKGPNNMKISTIKNEFGTDLTHSIDAFFGPNLDFHTTTVICPKYLGQKKLIFYMNDGSFMQFENKEKITI